MHNWYIFETFDLASIAAADFIASQIDKAIHENNICYVILPGGNTPKLCLGYLSEKNLAWEKVHWYLSDERCYPIDHKDRNDTMLSKYLWSKISKTNIYPIPVELGAEEAAKRYREQIDKIDSFDVAFLGVGEDGHTASLFPGNRALNDSASVIPVFNSPKPPKCRVSLGIGVLSKTKTRIILAGGDDKSDITERVKSGDNLPVNNIGEINWFLDSKASGM